MALAEESVMSVDWGFQDNNGNTSSTSLWLPAALTQAGADAYVLNVAAALDALSNANLMFASSRRAYFDAALVGAIPDPSSEVERKLRIEFGTANRYVKVTMEVPSPIFTIEVPGTDEVPISNPLIQALGDAVINGALGPGNGAVASSGLDLVAINRAYIIHRHRKAGR